MYTIVSSIILKSTAVYSNSNLKALKIVQFETGGNGRYRTGKIIFFVPNFSKYRCSWRYWKW